MIANIGARKPFRLFIKEWIGHKGLSQHQVAERIGCSPGTISKLISGEMRRTDEWLAAIAYALGEDMHITDLYRHPEQPTQEDLLDGLSQEERAKVVKVIKALTGTEG